MPTSEEIDEKNAPLVKAYQDKIEMLSGLIDKLEDTKRTLDTKVASHQAHGLNIEAAETNLRELLKEIEIKNNLTTETSTELGVLLSKKTSLQGEIDSLQTSVDIKKEYLADIESYPPKIKALQEDMEKFHDDHAEAKKTAQQELSEIKNQVENIHTHIGKILDK